MCMHVPALICCCSNDAPADEIGQLVLVEAVHDADIHLYRLLARVVVAGLNRCLDRSDDAREALPPCNELELFRDQRVETNVELVDPSCLQVRKLLL